MKHFSRTIALFGLFLFSLPAFAADGRNTGRISGVIKSVSGNPLRDAVIRIIKEAQQGKALTIATTDSRGFFKCASLTPGMYYLEVSRQGYQPVTTTKFIIDSGRTASLDIVLHEFIGLISNDDDPRNQDLKTVLRSTADRRLIFRGLPDNLPDDAEANQSPFYRSGAMNIASNTAINENYLGKSQASPSGVSSNFAITEPINPHSRMILSGQLDFGRGAFWRVRNTFNYRPNKDHDYRMSVGYGQMNVNYPGSSSISSQLISQESGLRDSGVQTLAFGLEGNTKFLDLMDVKYGFDYSRLHYGNSRSFFYPSVQIVVHPAEGWNVKTSFSSRRSTDTNSVILPDGEILDLSEPTLITMVGDRVSMREIRHSEFSAQKELTQYTAVEFAVYQDRVQGPGLPIMITTVTPTETKSRVVEMKEDQTGQRGVRVSVQRKIADNLSGSISYVYGDAVSIVGANELILNAEFDGNPSGFLRQRNQHSLTGKINAVLPLTKTNIVATMRWYPGNPLTPVDWFSDYMEIGSKSANLEFRQAIPVPEFLGTTGRWEVLIDLRNVMNQGREVLPTNDGEIVLNRNPRSLRFGLNLNFR